MSYAVIGLGFGDEGKGLITSYLAKKNPSYCVYRFSGGPQASHKVMLNEKDWHIFSNFGSGSLHNLPTNISSTCLVDPISMLDELEVLISKGKTNNFFINRDSVIITPYDVEANAKDHINLTHGTCGRGINKSIQREHNHYSLTFKDLAFPSVLKLKLEGIRKYYFAAPSQYEELFLKSCEIIYNHYLRIKNPNGVAYPGYIYEGSQGLLLDQDIGFFPHVTRAYTGTFNIYWYQPKVFLVTRAYQTRHGNGPMTNEEHTNFKIKLSKYEHNVSNEFQGNFRKSMLDLDLMKYAIDADDYIRETEKNIAITCLDNIEEYKLTENGIVKTFKTEEQFVEHIINALNIEGKVLLSRTPFTDEVEEFR